MRSLLALGASFLAGLAAVISSLDGDADLVPFYVGLTFLGGVGAWGSAVPAGPRLWVARVAALLWLVAAIWVAVLLVMSVTVWQASSPPPTPEDTYFGLTATVYRVMGLYGGMVLMLISAFGPVGLLARSMPSRSTKQTFRTPP